MNCPNCNSTTILDADDRRRGWRRPRISTCTRCRYHFDRSGVVPRRDSANLYDMLRLF